MWSNPVLASEIERDITVVVTPHHITTIPRWSGWIVQQTALMSLVSGLEQRQVGVQTGSETSSHLFATVTRFADPHADTSVRTAMVTRQNTSISADPQ
jgi:hypothetical protein